MGRALKTLQSIWGLVALYASVCLAVRFINELELAPTNFLWSELVKLAQLWGPGRLFSSGAAISVLLILVAVSLVVLANHLDKEVELW